MSRYIFFLRCKSSDVKYHVDRAKGKGVFEHAKNTHIRFIPRMRNSHIGICSPLIHSAVSNDSGSRQECAHPNGQFWF